MNINMMGGMANPQVMNMMANNNGAKIEAGQPVQPLLNNQNNDILNSFNISSVAGGVTDSTQ